MSYFQYPNREHCKYLRCYDILEWDENFFEYGSHTSTAGRLPLRPLKSNKRLQKGYKE